MEAVPIGFVASIPWLPKVIRILSVFTAFIGTLGVYSGVLFFIILYYQSPNPSPIELLWLFPSIFYLGVGIPIVSAGLYNNRWSIIGNYVGALLGALVFFLVTIWGAALQWNLLANCSTPRAGTFDVYFCAAKSFLDGFLAIVVISWVMTALNVILGGIDLVARGVLAGPRLPGQPDIPLIGTHMHHEPHQSRVYPVNHKMVHHSQLYEAPVYDDDEYQFT
jgi:hypothetical protein